MVGEPMVVENARLLSVKIPFYTLGLLCEIIMYLVAYLAWPVQRR